MLRYIALKYRTLHWATRCLLFCRIHIKFPIFFWLWLPPLTLPLTQCCFPHSYITQKHLYFCNPIGWIMNSILPDNRPFMFVSGPTSYDARSSTYNNLFLFLSKRCCLNCWAFSCFWDFYQLHSFCISQFQHGFFLSL